MAERRAREPDLASVRIISYTMLLTLVLVLLSGLVLWKAYENWRPQPAAPQFAAQPMAPGQPRLQRNPRADMLEYTARVQQRMHSLGWVDRQAGVVHIPIESAITLLLERGLPQNKEKEKEKEGEQEGARQKQTPQEKAVTEKAEREGAQ